MEIFVVGAGYVGLTTAVGFMELGHRVTAHDVDGDRVAGLQAGRSPIFEPGLEEAIGQGLADGRLTFTTDPTPPSGTEIAVVCVPTPSGPDGLLDTAIVESVVAGLLRSLSNGAVVVVRSTLPLHGPDRLAAIAGDGPDGPSIVVNPEFMREGKALADSAAPSRVVVGYLRSRDKAAAEMVAGLYGSLGAPTLVADFRSAVLIKLASNVFLGTKIAFADELARLADAIGADVTVVADGIGLDPRIGRSFLDSGPGFGGSCLPEQAAAIAVETASRGIVAPLLGSIATSNSTHREEIVRTVGRLLPGGLRGARVALLGLAFKAGTDDVRHSPALAIAAALRASEAEVVAFDPVAAANARRADPALETADSAAAAVSGADAVIVVTEWPEFATLDWAGLRPTLRGDLVYDARRILDAPALRAVGYRCVALGQPEGSAASRPSRRGTSADRPNRATPAEAPSPSRVA